MSKRLNKILYGLTFVALSYALVIAFILRYTIDDFVFPPSPQQLQASETVFRVSNESDNEFHFVYQQ